MGHNRDRPRIKELVIDMSKVERPGLQDRQEKVFDKNLYIDKAKDIRNTGLPMKFRRGLLAGCELFHLISTIVQLRFCDHCFRGSEALTDYVRSQS